MKHLSLLSLRLFTLIFSLLALSLSNLNAANIGLLVMATGKYIAFVPPLVDSAKKFFCQEHEVTFFVFTDQQAKPIDNVVYIYQSRLGWPYDTMMRFHTYFKHRDIYADMDYLFACDADMLFVGRVGSEILGDRVATQHPGFIGKRGTYETNPTSLAYIAPHEGKYYFAGGFYGGSFDEVMKIAKTCADNIDKDLAKGFVAVWHDESHWNRYCIDNPPTIILNPSYCYPESWNLPYPKKLLALDKNHSEFRK